LIERGRELKMTTLKDVGKEKGKEKNAAMNVRQGGPNGANVY
jgi:hypothetical protein